ncbi:uncharacterized protein [Miscanthus floridulus]|uniref:uncharacterized protein n=1 Tax=Miscanthus floridulus TaxID=154761 RepID=UPI003459A7D4
MAVAEVAIEVPPQQQPPPPPAATREPAVVPRVLQYLYLASAWVACAGVAAATVARRALGDSSPVVWAFLKVSIGALVFPALLILVFAVRVLRAMLAAGFRRSLRIHAREIQIQARKMFGALTWKALQDPILLAWLASFLFILLLGASVLVFVGLLPVEESHRERIGYALSDVAVLGAMSMYCFIIIPSFALKLWGSK